MKKILSLLTVFALIGCNDLSQEIYQCTYGDRFGSAEMKLELDKSTYSGIYQVSGDTGIYKGALNFQERSMPNDAMVYVISINGEPDFHIDKESLSLTVPGRPVTGTCSKNLL